jgi:hypothetical protein
MPTLAEKIIATCQAEFAAHSGDCNGFMKAVAGHYFANLGMDGLNADGIGDLMIAGTHGWKTLANDPAAAIAAAIGDGFVVAAMKTTDFDPPQAHGHLAVVVGLPGQPSGTVVVPLCYAGSLGGPTAYGQRVSTTFPAKAARAGGIRYFTNTPDQQPA